MSSLGLFPRCPMAGAARGLPDPLLKAGGRAPNPSPPNPSHIEILRQSRSQRPGWHRPFGLPAMAGAVPPSRAFPLFAPLIAKDLPGC